MRLLRRSWSRAGIFSLLCCLGFFFPLEMAAQSGGRESIAVVVHPDTPVENLSLAEVRRVFRSERQYWSAQMPVVLLIRAPVAHERDVVLNIIFEMSEARFKQYWIAKIFRAEAVSAPKVVYTNSMAGQLLAAVPGAIAFMAVSDVRVGLKVLRVDGFLPGDSKYPLR